MGACTSLLHTPRDIDSSTTPRDMASSKTPRDVVSSKMDLLKNGLESFNNKFFQAEKLSSGHSSVVWKGVRKLDGKTYVLKRIIHDRLKYFENEVNFLSILNHENIIKMEGAYYDDNYFYLCTEYCSGGRLLDKVKKLGPVSEKNTSKIIRTIINAIKFCHDQDIVHLDLKSDNIMYDRNGKLQIIDWGTAIHIDHNKKYDDFVGTVHYMGPEILRIRKAWELKKSDMFAIGVITFSLLTGHFPFKIKKTKDIERQRKSKIVWRSYEMSAKAKDFIESLLDENTSTRLSAEEALNHPFLQTKFAHH